MKDYKILGNGEGFKAEISAKAATATAIEKMEKAGGKIILPVKKEVEKIEKIASKDVPSKESKEESDSEE